MQYMRCKCGNRQCWTTMGASSCEVCEECGSTLGYGPNSHPEKTPHRVHAEIRGGKVEARCLNCRQVRPVEEAENIEQVRAAIRDLAASFPPPQ